MPKLSVIIPSRDEKFLTPTIDDIFRNGRGDLEVVTVIDSNLWPEGWKETVERHSPRLHTIFHGTPLGMRRSINDGVASAISRGAKFVAKFDAHCSFSEGFDEALKAECDADWVVVPRRGRLNPEAWTATDTHKPDIDYHYLSFPDDPNDFGGPGLNGKPWNERAIDRKHLLIDDEMSSQGSGWFMYADYFTRLGLMDETSYGPFWNEFQEIGLKAWLSGGAVKVNKKCKYLHLHKGSKYGRGYKLNESWLKLGRDHTMKWIWNEAWDERQTRPFSWLIEHFWPVPSWPENWEELLYATRKPRSLVSSAGMDSDNNLSGNRESASASSSLTIYQANYGLRNYEGDFIDVTQHLQSLVKNNSLDIIVNNSTLTPGQNPFRGKKKRLHVVYSLDGIERVERIVEEKDWLIIGPVQQQQGKSVLLSSEHETTLDRETSQLWAGLADKMAEAQATKTNKPAIPQTPTALNDYLIRRFSISPQRLRGPMPIELRDFHRNDLAQLFAELGFNYGVEVGVAEANYSAVLMKANPTMKLLLVDPWHHYSANPQGKSKEKHEYAYSEAKRKMSDYHNVEFLAVPSMTAVPTVDENSLDFCYIDGNHSFDFVMQDLIEWSKRVRSGGIVSGDDYYALDQKRWVGGGVVEAVQAYVNAHRIPIWWLFEGHKSVDFMWVKP